MIKNLRFLLSIRRYYFRQLLTKQGEFELRLLKQYVDRRRVAIDIGANNGTYSYHLSRYAPRVIAFEPNPAFEHYLGRLPSRVSAEYVALSDQNGKGTLSIPVFDASEAFGWASLEAPDRPARGIEVPIRSLDSYDLDPGFIKIDVEGHEYTVLLGARETIRKSRPPVLVEVEERRKQGSIAAVFKFFEGLNYDGFFFVDGQRKSISEFNVNIHQKDPPEGPAATTERQSLNFYNNFLFLPKS